MKITKHQLKQIIKEQIEEELDSRELEPAEALDAADHAIEIMDALKDLISNTLNEVLQSALNETVEKDPSYAEVGDYLSIRVGDYAEDTLVEVFDSPPGS